MSPTPTKANSSIWSTYLTAQAAKIPPLAPATQLSERVVRILGGNPGHMQLQGTNTYLVGTGEERMLIDTGQGMPFWIENLTAYLDNHNLRLSHILLTHWHGDHTGGLIDLLDYLPSLSNNIYKSHPDPNQQPVADNQTFSCLGATLRASFTPGHSHDHLCFILEEEKALFTGDNILGHGFSVVEDLGTYMKTLNKMSGLGCEKGYPGHGEAICSLPSRIQLYTKHQERREVQVYSTLISPLSAGIGVIEKMAGKRIRSLTIRELVDCLHGHVSDEIFEKALEPFLTQVLWKLAEDRKVGFRVEGTNRRWFAKPGEREEAKAIISQS